MKKIFGFLVFLIFIAAVAYAVPLLPNVLTPRTPAADTDNCSKGGIWFDNNYLYWCYADNNIRRTGYDNTW